MKAESAGQANRVRCCVAGGGPAGVMVGFLLARAGIETLVLEQRRRTLPTRVTQGVQVFLQERVLDRVLDRDEPVQAPWPLRLFNRWPWLRRIPPRVIGVGVRPEHVRSPARARDAAAG